MLRMTFSAFGSSNGLKNLLLSQGDKEGTHIRLDETQSAKAVEQKIQTIEEKIYALQAMKSVLLELTAACSGEGSVHHCPIIKSLDVNPAIANKTR